MFCSFYITYYGCFYVIPHVMRAVKMLYFVHDFVELLQLNVVVVVDWETSICTEFLPLADNHFEVITDGETKL